MGIETRVDVLEFTDGIKAIFTNKDRKHHLIIPAGMIFTSLDEYFDGTTKYYYRQMKTTYEQWKNRWATWT